MQERVDSVTSSPGQLVLSALLFTSAFLLVPTTALFFLFLLLPCLAVALTRHTLFLTSRFLSSIPLHYLLSSGATPSASSQVTVSHSLACCTRTSSSRASSPSQASVMPLADLGGLVGPLLSGQRYALGLIGAALLGVLPRQNLPQECLLMDPFHSSHAQTLFHFCAVLPNLYYTALHCAVLYRAVLYCIISCRTVLPLCCRFPLFQTRDPECKSAPT